MRNLISERDSNILGYLLASNGGISSRLLSEEIGLSLSATRARRRMLTEEYLTITYSLNFKRFGWRQIEVLINTQGGRSQAVGEELLKRKQVLRVAKTVGQFSVDLKADVLVRNSQELLDMLEAVKSIEGVSDAIWVEAVEVVGTKIQPPQLRTHEATPPNPALAPPSRSAIR